MSTRSATIIRQTTYWGKEADTEELMRFYRHCDGYPEGHGIDMALSVIEVDGMAGIDPRSWCQPFLVSLLSKPITVEFEPPTCQHGDLEYLYVIDSIADYRLGARHDGRLTVTINLYGMGWDEDYEVAMERTPIFSGTAYEYIERFGKER